MTGTADLSALLTVDRLIHEPSRLVLLAILNAVERADFTYLSRETGMTKGNLSSHLSKLEEAGYIAIEKTYKGKTPLTLCQITAEGTAAFEAYVAQIQEFLRLVTG